MFAAEGGVPVLALAPDDYSRVRLEGALGSWGVDGGVLPLSDVEADPDLLPRRLLALAEGRDEVRVPEDVAALARRAVERMIAIGSPGSGE